MKKLLIFSIFVVVIVGLSAGAYFWWISAVSAPSTDSSTKRIVITKGASGEKIGQILKDAGVIKNTFAFKLYLQSNNLTKKLPVGEFSIPANLTLEEVIKKLQAGPTQVWVTIPEGKRREEVAERVINGLSMDVSRASEFRKEFLAQTTNSEGFLFPDTYLFPKEASASAVVKRMTSTFDQKFTAQMKDDLRNSGLSLNSAVTLASIIERETLTAEERPVVAGILFNRLEAGWPLQTDATIQYFIGERNCRNKVDCDWWPKSLTRDDLDINSPFNTYKNTGLPPHPIANPGITSLKAVVYSEKTPFWFYLHDSEGTIRYGRTLEEHNSNISKYLKK